MIYFVRFFTFLTCRPSTSYVVHPLFFSPAGCTIVHVLTCTVYKILSPLAKWFSLTDHADSCAGYKGFFVTPPCVVRNWSVAFVNVIFIYNVSIAVNICMQSAVRSITGSQSRLNGEREIVFAS